MNEPMVFCSNWTGDEKYELFRHEADVLLYALGREVAAQFITSEEARDIYALHYDIEDTYLIQPEDIESEKAAYWRDWERYYESKEDVEEELKREFGEYGNFPLNEEMDVLPNSMDFWEEAASLRLKGVGFSHDESPASGPIFEVANPEALVALKEALDGRYRILVCGDDDDYGIEDHETAIAFIERMRGSG